MQFGKFDLKVKSTFEATQTENKEFIEIIKALVRIFEIDTIYPECCKLLKEQREEKKNKLAPKQLLGDMFGMFIQGLAMLDIFGLLDDDPQKKKKKKIKGLQSGD